MVEKKGLGKAVGHAVLWFGIAIVLFPLYIALVATTHTFDVLIGSTPLWFGGEFLKNFTTVLTQGLKAAGGIPVWVMMANSLVMGPRHRHRENRHLHHGGLRHRLFPFPRPRAVLRAHLHHPDDAG